MPRVLSVAAKFAPLRRILLGMFHLRLHSSANSTSILIYPVLSLLFFSPLGPSPFSKLNTKMNIKVSERLSSG